MKKVFTYSLILISLGIRSSQHPTEENTIASIEVSEEDPRLHQSGALVYLDDIPFTGVVFSNYSNGQTASRRSFFKGKKHGEHFVYYENGNLKEIRFYASNRKEGHHQGWWPNGNQKFDYYFKKGLEYGESKEWFESGQAYRVFHYENGKEIGSQKMWETDGSIRANYIVKNGHRYGLIGLKNCKSVSDEKGVFTAINY